MLFVDASQLFDRGTNQNILGKAHREKILEVLAAREEREHFSALVPVEKLLEQEANLAVSSLVLSRRTPASAWTLSSWIPVLRVLWRVRLSYAWRLTLLWRAWKAESSRGGRDELY